MDIVRKEENNNGNLNQVECHYNGATIFISLKKFKSIVERMQYDNRKFVRYKEGAHIYGMSEREFNKLAHEAKAVYKRDKMALISVQLVDEYLEAHRNDEEV